MPIPKRRHLQLPVGVERAYLDRSRRHRLLLARIHSCYELAGYVPIDTPLVDYYESYQQLLTPQQAASAYRLVGADGDLLLLRPDITLFLAKQLAGSLRDDELPARVCYSDFIVRRAEAEEISRKEYFQTGIELVGRPGMDGDLETLCMLIEVLDAVGTREYALHLGSRSLFDACFPPEARDQAASALRRRDFAALAGLGSAPPALFSHIAPAAAGHGGLGANEGGLSADAREALGRVRETAERLAGLFPEVDIRLDLSEVGSQPYYTGIVFRVYAAGVGSAVASGGRYDGLLAHFGRPAESVGFSLMLRKLEDEGSGEPVTMPALPRIQADRFEDAYREAVRRRNGGEAATL